MNLFCKNQRSYYKKKIKKRRGIVKSIKTTRGKNHGKESGKNHNCKGSKVILETNVLE